MGSNPVSTTYWQLSIIGAGEKQNVQIVLLKLGHIVNVKSNWFWLRRNIFFLKMGHSRPLFLYFRLFNTVESKMFNIIFCRWLDSNLGPLVGSDRSTNWATTTAQCVYLSYKRPTIVNFNARHRTDWKVVKSTTVAFKLLDSF